MKFEDAIEFVLAHEGGYANDPDDPGGETNFGISRRWAARAGVLVNLRELTRDKAVELYREHFWDPYPFFESTHHNRIGTKVFDALVNMGPAPAFKILQRALRACGARVKADGILGPASMRSYRAVTEDGETMLLAAYRSEMAGRYRLIAQRRPASRKFLKGWLKRAYA